MALLLPPSASGSNPLTSGSSANPLTDLLRSPEDLLKLSNLRKKLLKEKAQIDARLNECVKSQLDETRDGLRRLQEAKNQVARLREEMIEIEQLKEGEEGDRGGDFEVYGKISKVRCTQTTTAHQSFTRDPAPNVPRIRELTQSINIQVATIHRNLTQTASIVNNLRTMSDKVAHLTTLLHSDQSHPLGPCGPSPNLLPIHYQLQQLEAFRNETLHQAKKSPSRGREEQAQEDRRILVQWFERLDELGNRFEEWLWAIGLNVLDTAKEGNGGAIVRLIKIVEVEGREDEKVSITRPRCR